MKCILCHSLLHLCIDRQEKILQKEYTSWLHVVQTGFGVGELYVCLF